MSRAARDVPVALVVRAVFGAFAVFLLVTLFLFPVAVIIDAVGVLVAPVFCLVLLVLVIKSWLLLFLPYYTGPCCS